MSVLLEITKDGWTFSISEAENPKGECEIIFKIQGTEDDSHWSMQIPMEFKDLKAVQSQLEEIIWSYYEPLDDDQVHPYNDGF